MSGNLSGAGGVGGLLASFDDDGSATSNSWWYTYDGNGNVSAVVNSADGILHESYDYSPFGELLGAKGTGVSANRFAFSTKYQDEETGLYYYGYRYYQPTTGRWLSRDPIGEKGGLCLYAMAMNDSVNSWDYLGLSGTSCCRCIIINVDVSILKLTNTAIAETNKPLVDKFYDITRRKAADKINSLAYAMTWEITVTWAAVDPVSLKELERGEFKTASYSSYETHVSAESEANLNRKIVRDDALYECSDETGCF